MGVLGRDEGGSKGLHEAPPGEERGQVQSQGPPVVHVDIRVLRWGRVVWTGHGDPVSKTSRMTNDTVAVSFSSL